MQNIKLNQILLATGFLIVLAGSISADDSTFDIMNLVGKWEGKGLFVVPMTSMEVDIEGTGLFVYDSLHNRIRTSMQGSKLMINYSDSGYLQHFPKTDSVSWEVWDSWGKHAKYWGIIENNMLKADRIDKKRNYRVLVYFPHPDTLDFRLSNREDDGTETNKATFHLWRVKE
jgi:hypothetical protein